MKGNMFIYYDEEGDFLEIGMEKHSNGYFKDIEEDVSVRIDEKTGNIVGIAIMNFKKRTKSLKDIELKLPLKIELSNS